jgi:site-specific recombinase XerD
MPLQRAVDRWLADGRAQGWSGRTLGNRRHLMEKFAWWLTNEAELPPTLASLSPAIIRAFLSYAREPRPEGRYGSTNANARGEARPSTIVTWHRHLRALANFLLAEGLLTETPMKNVRPPKQPKDEIPPLSPEQVQLLLDAARRGRASERDVALVLVLLDTGLRVSELCSLCVRDVDRGAGELDVTGKGGKRRRVYLGVRARRALWRYLESDRRQAPADEPLFISIGGNTVGAALTTSGIGHLIRATGQIAGITGVQVSPHNLRRTFAIQFLKGGGDIFHLQKLMGHEDLTVLRRYVAYADADLAEAHRSASPADRMRLK